MKCELAYFIGTTKSYFDQTVGRVTKEAQLSGIPCDDLVIVSSQEDSNDCVLVNGCKVFKVTYTGIHLTPLIFLSEHLEEYSQYTHFCLLHSTSKIGLNFRDTLSNYLNQLSSHFDGIPLNKVRGGLHTKDMGILSFERIYFLKNYFDKIKLETYSAEDLLNLKKQLICDENLIFGLTPAKPAHATRFDAPIDSKPTLAHAGIEDVSNLITQKVKFNNEILLETYYPSLDIYKYQRTYNGLRNISMSADGSIP